MKVRVKGYTRKRHKVTKTFFVKANKVKPHERHFPGEAPKKSKS